MTGTIPQALPPPWHPIKFDTQLEYEEDICPLLLNIRLPWYTRIHSHNKEELKRKTMITGTKPRYYKE